MKLELRFEDRGTVTIDDNNQMFVKQTSSKKKLLNRTTILKVYDTIFRSIDKISSTVPSWDQKSIDNLRNARWLEAPTSNNHITFYYTAELWKQHRHRYTKDYSKLKLAHKKLKYEVRYGKANQTGTQDVPKPVQIPDNQV